MCQLLHATTGRTIILPEYSGHGTNLAVTITQLRLPSSAIVQAPTLVFASDITTKWGELPGYDARINAASDEVLVQTVRNATANYRGPLLIMESADDDVVSRNVLAAWRRAFPAATYHVIPHALHSLRLSPKSSQTDWSAAITKHLA